MLQVIVKIQVISERETRAAFLRSLSLRRKGHPSGGMHAPWSLPSEIAGNRAGHFYEYATLPANLCPFSGRRERARFGNDFSKAVGEAVEEAARSSVWQRPAKHLEHMLGSEQRINQTIEASSGSKRRLRLRNKMPRF